MNSLQTTYKPDLNEFITQCELNYWLILKLIPFLNTKSNNHPSSCSMTKRHNGQIRFQTKSKHYIDFEFVERAKYTTTILVDLKMPQQAKMNLMVRLYHDLELLEVMDKMGPKALKPINSGPELAIKQTDEKRQLNRFLGESLTYCLAQNRLVSIVV